MATYTSNYGWTKPSGSDNVDISVLNNNLDDQDSTIHDAFLNMAPPFSESSTYAANDIVLYDTGLYKCHTAVVTPGSWTGSTNWQVYKLSEGGGGGGGTSNYNDLTNKPSINGVTITGNKTTSDLGIDKTAVGLGNVPNVSTNDQTPTFTEASTRNNIASGEKLSVIMGKIAKFFNDLKTVAFTGSYTDLTNQPQINGNTLSGNKTTSDLGINATNVMMSDGVTSVEDALDELAEKTTTYIQVTNSGNETLSSMLDRLFAAVDVTKITPRSVLLVSDMVIYQLYVKTSTAFRYTGCAVTFSNQYRSITELDLKQSGSTAIQSTEKPTGEISVNDFSSRISYTSVRLYY